MTEADTYDYVVVGAGSAGCVLANRLSAAHEVLLLEAGEPDERREIPVPAAWPELLESAFDWGFRTVPQPALDDRRVYAAQGKGLGGSSSINAQLYVRGHPSDYDRWAAAGNEGWDHETAADYFDRLEDGPGPAYGSGGPQHVAEPDAHPLAEAFLEAAAATGFERVEDFNDGDGAGAGYYRVTQQDGARHSAADAYLKPVLDRSTLTVRTGAFVRRVDVAEGRATGVTYRHEGVEKRAVADAEVVVSAGAINSPHLLLRSGVGPAAHLREHGVDVRVDLPGVGENLQDHPVVWVNYDASTTRTLDDAGSLWDVLRYTLLKRGPLATNGAEVGAFWRSESGLSAPDVQFMFGRGYVERNGLGDPPDDGHGFSVGTVLVRPESRGRVRFRSADPTDDPAIDPQYLADPADLAAIVDGVRTAMDVAEAAPLDDYRAGRNWPGERGRAAVRDHVRANATSLYHPVGTCRMGDGEDAVVDDRLRVHGVDRLRVVDASVMPDITTGNTNAPTLMLAERAADLLTGGA